MGAFHLIMMKLPDLLDVPVKLAPGQFLPPQVDLDGLKEWLEALAMHGLFDRGGGEMCAGCDLLPKFKVSHRSCNATSRNHKTGISHWIPGFRNSLFQQGQAKLVVSLANT